MNTKMLIYGAGLTGLFCAAALACLPPTPCPPCTRPRTAADPPSWPDCVWKCGVDDVCCKKACCYNACCDEVTCYNYNTHQCCNYRTGKICPKDRSCCGTNCCTAPYCCDQKTCFDAEAGEHCCYYGTGKVCPPGQHCCSGDCCPVGQPCCDGITCYDPAVKKCCNYENGKTCNIDEVCCDGGLSCYDPFSNICCGYGDGTTCNLPCCDSWDCQYCFGYGYGCATCLRKVNYTQLQWCNKVPDPDWTPEPNGCSSPTGDNPTMCPTTSFKSACDAHDICYQTCGSDKAACDSSFDIAMNNACAGSNPICWTACQGWRTTYRVAVELVGQGAYETDQELACACCDC